MEQHNRINRPAGPANIQPQQNIPNQQPKRSGGKDKNKTKFIALAAVAVLVIGVFSFVLGGALGSKDGGTFVLGTSSDASSAIKKDKYQAVFLNSTDGQVYFGKLEVLNNDYYKLSDIYYVRVEQVQPNPEEQPQQNISLAKLGNEIHGPEDEMFIRNEHVMFWENLKDDGQVVTAIKEYKANGGDNSQTQQQPTNQDSNGNN